MSNARILLIILIATEALGWWCGAQLLWRSRSSKDGRRTPLGIIAALFFTLAGCAQLFSTVTNIKYGAILSQCIPADMEWRSLVSSGVRAFSVWMISLNFSASDHPGPLRLRLNRGVERLRG